jgi:hypothetical protein
MTWPNWANKKSKNVKIRWTCHPPNKLRFHKNSDSLDVHILIRRKQSGHLGPGLLSRIVLPGFLRHLVRALQGGLRGWGPWSLRFLLQLEMVKSFFCSTLNIVTRWVRSTVMLLSLFTSLSSEIFSQLTWQHPKKIWELWFEPGSAEWEARTQPLSYH